MITESISRIKCDQQEVFYYYCYYYMYIFIVHAHNWHWWRRRGWREYRKPRGAAAAAGCLIGGLACSVSACFYHSSVLFACVVRCRRCRRLHSQWKRLARRAAPSHSRVRFPDRALNENIILLLLYLHICLVKWFAWDSLKPHTRNACRRAGTTAYNLFFWIFDFENQKTVLISRWCLLILFLENS